MKKLLLIIGSFALITSTSFAQQSMELSPSKDNTLFEDVNGDLSSGSGVSIYAGNTNTPEIRRAVIAFDLSVIPANAIITKVTLKLSLEQGKGTADMNLHKLTSNWGEGASISPGGQGTQAQNNDATWIHTFYNSQMWTNPGGDFEVTPSATTSVGATVMTYEWTSAQMATDVEAWIATPATNFGWILIGDEVTLQTAKKFASKESVTAGLRPVLVVEYDEDKSSVNKLVSADIAVYPNPTQGDITITLDRNLSTATVEVIDLLGNSIATETMTSTTTINIADRPKGIYYVIVKTENGTITKKITKL